MAGDVAGGDAAGGDAAGGDAAGGDAAGGGGDGEAARAMLHRHPSTTSMHSVRAIVPVQGTWMVVCFGCRPFVS